RGPRFSPTGIYPACPTRTRGWLSRRRARRIDSLSFAGRCTMGVTYFGTYLRALDACADVQGVLGDEWVIHLPNPDYGYESTPRNALTFGCMGVDGVHYAILAIDDGIMDESPVIQICPMDFSDLYQAKGDSFLMFLADA